MADEMATSLDRVQRIGYKARLEEKVALEGSPTGRLNPTWVEWLMGFPLGWTDLEDLETQ
jgi:DNA (cytosine-5)-methyltransferase 1